MGGAQSRERDRQDVAAEVCVDRAHSARIYDYYLGGKDNYEADRRAAEDIRAAFPAVRRATRANRDFMHRAIRYLAGTGIRQFLDIGTGIPTEPNLHQIAQEVIPDARVVYVDNDPIVLTHARALLIGTPEGATEYIHADVEQPCHVLNAPELHETLDLTRPVALSLLALLHFVPDDCDPYGIVSTLVDALAPGSYLVMSHATGDFMSEAAVSDSTERYRREGIAFRTRTRTEFARFFTGLDLVEPGITVAHRWHVGIRPAASTDCQVSFYAGVARKQ